MRLRDAGIGWLVLRRWAEWRVTSSPDLWKPPLPLKLNQNHRHHIPQVRRRVTNWPACASVAA